MPLPLGRRAELAMLLALCFFLPIYEAPKNVAWLAYVLIWLANRARSRDFGGRWDGWDTLIALWMASGFLVAAFAGLHGSEWHAALDIVRYAGAGWLVKRSRLADGEVRWVLGALVVSVLLGLAMAYAQLWSGSIDTLQLNSVGHVNHTAIYLAIMLGLCTSWLFTDMRRVLAAASATLVLVSLFVAASRAGVVVGMLVIVALAAAWWPRSRKPALLAAGVVALYVASAFLGTAEVFEKQEANVQQGHTLAFRDRVWRVAITTWEQHPWFGVGMDNFARVTGEEEARYRGLFPHAHSLYLNALAERGIVGTAPLAAVLIAWPVWLFRRRRHPRDGDLDWVLWGAAASAWLVTVVVGLVNTTLHHEHGLLAALLLGLWLARAHQR